MKKIITIALLFVLSISSGCLANGKDTDIQLRNILRVIMKNVSRVEWTSNDNFKRISFTFKRKEVWAYYDTNDKLLGFSVHLNISDLPKSALQTISKKYCDCVVSDVIMFLYPDSRIDYYAGIKNSKIYIALKVTPNGRVKAIQKIRLQ